ncbi:MAG: VWA domain-containing protein [Pseudobacteriovorax sp.]|nr:VWA domain-containing protein [Pseudobacteriovorax sp.]
MRPFCLLLLSFMVIACQDSDFVGSNKNVGKPIVEPPPTVQPEPVPTPEPPPTVNPVEPPPPVCTEEEEIQGAHFVFLIDNSGSMRETDCPDKTGTGSWTTCQETNREKSILATFDELKAVFEESGSEDALSYLSIAQFTPKASGLPDTLEKANYLTVPTKDGLRPALAEALKFNRRPDGGTPYKNAMDLAHLIKKAPGVPSEMQKIYVLLTDGEPTDTNPSDVLNLANELDGIRFTLRVNHEGISVEDRENRLKTQAPQNFSRIYPSRDAYIDALMSLGADITTDKSVIEVTSSDQLETAIFEDILDKTIKETCDDA